MRANNDIRTYAKGKSVYLWEVAEEMGILDKVLEEGWRSLSAKETGKIGGMMTSRKRKNENS